MRFYKYHKPGNLEFNMLRSGEVFFASRAELNDAHESRPRYILRGSTELWLRLVHLILAHVHSRLHPNISQSTHFPKVFELIKPVGHILKKKAGNKDVGIEELSLFFIEALRATLSDRQINENDSRFLISLSEEFIKQTIPSLLDEPAYVASFSRNPTNPTMWGHYADAERGFVIIYHSNDGKVGVHSPIPILDGVRPPAEGSLADFEIGIYKEDRLQLTAVNYRTRPPKVNAFQRLVPKFLYTEIEDHYDYPDELAGKVDEKQEQLVGWIKYSDWRYEREVRAFLPVHGNLPPDARVLRIAPQDIAGLIFGPRMSHQDKMRAIACCYLMRESARGFAPTLPIFVFMQARQAIERYALDIHPIGILDGMLTNHLLPFKEITRLDAAMKDKLQRMCDEIKEDTDAKTIAQERGP